MKPNDKIILAGLRFYGYHGVLPEEKRLGQWFEVDLELAGFFTQAADKDDLSQTLDYRSLYQKVAQIVEGESLNLLETLTDRIAETVLAFSQVEEARVCVKKPGVDLGGPLQYAAVETVRRKKQSD